MTKQTPQNRHQNIFRPQTSLSIIIVVVVVIIERPPNPKHRQPITTPWSEQAPTPTPPPTSPPRIPGAVIAEPVAVAAAVAAAAQTVNHHGEGEAVDYGLILRML
jgi:hypothetical protein